MLFEILLTGLSDISVVENHLKRKKNVTRKLANYSFSNSESTQRDFIFQDIVILQLIKNCLHSFFLTME